jgi:hypothetical protein
MDFFLSALVNRGEVDIQVYFFPSPRIKRNLDLVLRVKLQNNIGAFLRKVYLLWPRESGEIKQCF